MDDSDDEVRRCGLSSSSDDEETAQLLAGSPAVARSAGAKPVARTATALSIADLNREKDARLAKRRCVESTRSCFAAVRNPTADSVRTIGSIG